MIKNFLLKPYGLLCVKGFKWFFSLTYSICIFVYLTVGKPVGFSLFSQEDQVRLALYYSVPTAAIWMLHVFVLQSFLFKEMRIGNTLLWLIWIHFSIGMYVYSCSEIFIFNGQFDWYFLPEILLGVFQLGGAITSIYIVAFSSYLCLARRRSHAMKD